MTSTPESAGAAAEFTWNYGYDASEDTMGASQNRRLRLMKASAGQEVMDDELGVVQLLRAGEVSGTFVIKDYETDKEVVLNSSRICLLPKDLSDDEEEDKPTYPIVKGVCHWEYKGNGVAEAYKEMLDEEAAAAMKQQQATIGTVLVDDCFGRVTLLSQVSGCDLVVRLIDTGEERQRTAWHLYVEDPHAPLLDGDDELGNGACTSTGASSAECATAHAASAAGNNNAGVPDRVEEQDGNEADTTATGADAHAAEDDGGDKDDAVEQLAIRNELVSTLNRVGYEWGFDPAGTDIVFYRGLVLVETKKTGGVVGGADGLQTTVPKISVGQVVRSCTTGFFLKVLGIYKPLAGFKVANLSVRDETVLVERDLSPEHTYAVARQPRYFGTNPGFFSGEKCVVVLAWNKQLGIVYACAELDAIDKTFLLVVNNDDAADFTGAEHEGKSAAAHEAWQENYLVTMSANSGGARVLDAKAFAQAHNFSVMKRRKLSNYITASEQEAAAKAAETAAEADKENNISGNRRRASARASAQARPGAAASAPAPAAAARRAAPTRAPRARQAATVACKARARGAAAAASRRAAAARAAAAADEEVLNVDDQSEAEFPAAVRAAAPPVQAQRVRKRSVEESAQGLHSHAPDPMADVHAERRPPSEAAVRASIEPRQFFAQAQQETQPALVRAPVSVPPQQQSTHTVQQQQQSQPPQPPQPQYPPPYAPYYGMQHAGAGAHGIFGGQPALPSYPPAMPGYPYAHPPFYGAYFPPTQYPPAPMMAYPPPYPPQSMPYPPAPCQQMPWMVQPQQPAASTSEGPERARRDAIEARIEYDRARALYEMTRGKEL